MRLGLLYESAAVSLLVQDDGQGFDPRSGWQSDQFGLRAMTERASALGATVDVDSLPGWGTRIRARFPYRATTEPPGPGCGCSWPRGSRRCGPAWPGCWPGPSRH